MKIGQSSGTNSNQKSESSTPSDNADTPREDPRDFAGEKMDEFQNRYRWEDDGGYIPAPQIHSC